MGPPEKGNVSTLRAAIASRSEEIAKGKFVRLADGTAQGEGMFKDEDVGLQLMKVAMQPEATYGRIECAAYIDGLLSAAHPCDLYLQILSLVRPALVESERKRIAAAKERWTRFESSVLDSYLGMFDQAYLHPYDPGQFLVPGITINIVAVRDLSRPFINRCPSLMNPFRHILSHYLKTLDNARQLLAFFRSIQDRACALPKTARLIQASRNFQNLTPREQLEKENYAQRLLDSTRADLVAINDFLRAAKVLANALYSDVWLTEKINFMMQDLKYIQRIHDHTIHPRQAELDYRSILPGRLQKIAQYPDSSLVPFPELLGDGKEKKSAMILDDDTICTLALQKSAAASVLTPQSQNSGSNDSNKVAAVDGQAATAGPVIDLLSPEPPGPRKSSEMETNKSLTVDAPATGKPATKIVYVDLLDTPEPAVVTANSPEKPRKRVKKGTGPQPGGPGTASAIGKPGVDFLVPDPKRKNEPPASVQTIPTSASQSFKRKKKGSKSQKVVPGTTADAGADEEPSSSKRKKTLPRTGQRPTAPAKRTKNFEYSPKVAISQGFTANGGVIDLNTPSPGRNSRPIATDKDTTSVSGGPSQPIKVQSSLVNVKPPMESRAPVTGVPLNKKEHLTVHPRHGQHLPPTPGTHDPDIPMPTIEASPAPSIVPSETSSVQLVSPRPAQTQDQLGQHRLLSNTKLQRCVNVGPERGLQTSLTMLDEPSSQVPNRPPITVAEHTAQATATMTTTPPSSPPPNPSYGAAIAPYVRPDARAHARISVSTRPQEQQNETVTTPQIQTSNPFIGAALENIPPSSQPQQVFPTGPLYMEQTRTMQPAQYLTREDLANEAAWRIRQKGKSNLHVEAGNNDIGQTLPKTPSPAREVLRLSKTPVKNYNVESPRYRTSRRDRASIAIMSPPRSHMASKPGSRPPVYAPQPVTPNHRAFSGVSKPAKASSKRPPYSQSEQTRESVHSPLRNEVFPGIQTRLMEQAPLEVDSTFNQQPIPRSTPMGPTSTYMAPTAQMANVAATVRSEGKAFAPQVSQNLQNRAGQTHMADTDYVSKLAPNNPNVQVFASTSHSSPSQRVYSNQPTSAQGFFHHNQGQHQLPLDPGPSTHQMETHSIAKELVSNPELKQFFELLVSQRRSMNMPIGPRQFSQQQQTPHALYGTAMHGQRQNTYTPSTSQLPPNPFRPMSSAQGLPTYGNSPPKDGHLQHQHQQHQHSNQDGQYQHIQQNYSSFDPPQGLGIHMMNSMPAASQTQDQQPFTNPNLDRYMTVGDENATAHQVSQQWSSQNQVGNFGSIDELADVNSSDVRDLLGGESSFLDGPPVEQNVGSLGDNGGVGGPEGHGNHKDNEGFGTVQCAPTPQQGDVASFLEKWGGHNDK